MLLYYHIWSYEYMLSYYYYNNSILLIISVDVISPLLDIDTSIYHSASFISLVLYLYHSPLVNVHKSKNLLGDG